MHENPTVVSPFKAIVVLLVLIPTKVSSIHQTPSSLESQSETPIMTSRKIVLAKSSDWDDLIYVVRTKADAADVWDLIDPNQAVKPAVLPKPTTPIFLIPDSSTPLTKDAYKKHKLQIKNYEILSTEYEKQKKHSRTLYLSFKIPSLQPMQFTSKKQLLILTIFSRFSKAGLHSPRKPEYSPLRSNTINYAKARGAKRWKIGWMIGPKHTTRHRNTGLKSPLEISRS